MSYESPPPAPLRLKSRARPSEVAQRSMSPFGREVLAAKKETAAAEDSVQNPPPVVPLKLKIKPKLAVENVESGDRTPPENGRIRSPGDVPSTGLASSAVGEICVPENPDSAPGAPRDLASAPAADDPQTHTPPAPASLAGPAPFKLKPRVAPDVPRAPQAPAASSPRESFFTQTPYPTPPLPGSEESATNPTEEPEPATAESDPVTEGSPFKLKAKAPQPEPFEASGVSVGNWPTSEIALPTSGMPSTVPSGSRPPVPNVIPIASLPIWQDPEKPEQSLVFKTAVTAAIVLVPLGLCVAAYFGWQFFNHGKFTKGQDAAILAPGIPEPEPAATAETPPPAAAAPAEPAPTPPVESRPLPPPEYSGTTPSLPAPSSGDDRPNSANGSSPFSTTIAPGVTAKIDGDVAFTAASPEFRAFVASVKISGVFQGANGRAFLNGRMTRVGEKLDPRLGIIFEDIDVEKKQLVFKDASGAIVTRKY